MSTDSLRMPRYFSCSSGLGVDPAIPMEMEPMAR